jgi:Mannosyltransferase (PIG-V)
MSEHDESAEARLHHLPRWARAADYLVFGLLALTLYVIVVGAIRLQVLGVRVSVSSPIRLLVQAGVIAALRYWRHAQPSTRAHADIILSKLRRRMPFLFPACWPRVVLTAVGVFIATRLTVLIVGYMAVQTFGYSIDSQPAWRVSYDELTNLPARWDSGWYLGIAEHGYEWNAKIKGQQNLVFFPAYPLVMRGAAWIMWRAASDPAKVIWSGVVVSLLTFPVAIGYLYNLARDQIGEDGALVAVALLAAYPFALFYSAAYTESLYLLAAVATFFHFTRGQLWRAAAWGLLTGLTRPNGWMASASLGLIALPALMSWLPPLAAARQSLQRWLPEFGESPITAALQRARPAMLVLAVCAPGFGLIIYCAYIFHLTGNPFTWAQLMTYWDRDFNGLSMLDHDLARLSARGFLGYLGVGPIDALNALALAFGVLTIWPVMRRLGLAYGLFVLVNIALPAASGGLVSIGRYSSVLFPSFIWLSAATPKPVRPALIALLAIGQGLAAALFFTWRAVY